MNRNLPLLATGLALMLALAVPAGAQTSHAPAAAQPPAATLPSQSLTPETLYTFLLAEIAGARGEIGVAVEAYLNLAQRTRDPRIARRATEIAMFARNLAATAEAARIWTEVEPESEEARRILAGALISDERRLDEVQLQFARVLATTPEQLEQNLLSLNRALAPVGDKQMARTIVQRLTEPYLDRPEAHFARAQAALTAEDGDGAQAAIDAALELRPDWEPGVLFKAHLMLQAGALEDAASLLDQYLVRHPESRNARLAHARTLVSARRFDAARSQFRTLLEAAPDDRDLMYAVALLSTQLNDLDVAASLFERALAAGHPDADTIRLNLGQIAERRNDPEGARRWYGTVTPGRHYLDAQVRIAGALAHQGKLQEAREHLHRVGGDDADTRKQMLLAETQLLRDAGLDKEAFELADAALQRSPEDGELLYESSMLAERLGRLDVMESRLRKLIALKPDHAHAHNALGYSLADRGLRLEEAEAMISQALQLAPNDPFILDSMGWVRFRRGAAADALDHLQRAYQLRPDPEIAAHLGEVLWSLERRDDATRVWNEALHAHPDNAAVKRTVERLRGQ